MKWSIGIRFASSCNAADVIDVVMRRDQIVDLLDAGVVDRRHDAIEIAAAGIAGVDQERLTGSA